VRHHAFNLSKISQWQFLVRVLLNCDLIVFVKLAFFCLLAFVFLLHLIDTLFVRMTALGGYFPWLFDAAELASQF
jgi:hypothetical protein